MSKVRTGRYQIDKITYAKGMELPLFKYIHVCTNGERRGGENERLLNVMTKILKIL